MMFMTIKFERIETSGDWVGSAFLGAFRFS
jgi:hypothetical protein